MCTVVLPYIYLVEVIIIILYNICTRAVYPGIPVYRVSGVSADTTAMAHTTPTQTLANNKKKKPQSLKLDAEAPRVSTSMYSVASSTQEDEDGEDPSPLRSEGQAAAHSPLTPGAAGTRDISGGVGTPVYVVNMDNLFEQDAILGKEDRPHRQSRCFGLCKTRDPDLD